MECLFLWLRVPSVHWTGPSVLYVSAPRSGPTRRTQIRELGVRCDEGFFNKSGDSRLDPVLTSDPSTITHLGEMDSMEDDIEEDPVPSGMGMGWSGHQSYTVPWTDDGTGRRVSETGTERLPVQDAHAPHNVVGTLSGLRRPPRLVLGMARAEGKPFNWAVGTTREREPE